MSSSVTVTATSEAGSIAVSDDSRSSELKYKWKSAARKKRKIAAHKSVDAGAERNLISLDNAPLLASPYDDKMRKLLQSNPVLLSNRVHIPWYRRYTEVIPDKDQQVTFQPFREIQTRDEDIALQHQFGTHECMQDFVSRGMCKLSYLECKRIREQAMARYVRIKKREEEKKEKDAHQPSDENGFTLPGQDIDLKAPYLSRL